MDSISKIYTKTGDEGYTSLIGGKRVKKDHPRIEAYGTVDELNANIGYIRDECENVLIKELLTLIQNKLFVIATLLATETEEAIVSFPSIVENDVLLLEKEIDTMVQSLPVLKHFILPGGNVLNSRCHIARCICRRAERKVIGLNELSTINPLLIKYLNRLSDLLFVLARYFSHTLQSQEIKWNPSLNNR